MAEEFFDYAGHSFVSFSPYVGGDGVHWNKGNSACLIASGLSS